MAPSSAESENRDEIAVKAEYGCGIRVPRTGRSHPPVPAQRSSTDRTRCEL